MSLNDCAGVQTCRRNQFTRNVAAATSGGSFRQTTIGCIVIHTLGLEQPERPKGALLFVGPTDIGKTEITNAFTS